jgi:hypothetical protein
MAAMGVSDPARLRPDMLQRRIDPTMVRSYGELYEWLSDGELVADCPQKWAADWSAAHPDTF